MSYSNVPCYRIITSNITKTFNAWIIDLHLKPITRILDGIRCKIIKLHNKRRESSMKWESNLVPQAEKRHRK